MGHAKNKKEWIILSRLVDVILENVEGDIIDIGMGLSTVVLSGFAITFDRVQHSCDNKKIFKDNICHNKHRIYIEGMLDFYKRFDQDSKIALVFMDGIHDYETNIETATHFLSIMQPNGVLFIHDTLPPDEKYLKPGSCHDVYKVRQELEMYPNTDTFTWPYVTQAQACGLTMVITKDPERPYYQQ